MLSAQSVFASYEELSLSYHVESILDVEAEDGDVGGGGHAGEGGGGGGGDLLLTGGPGVGTRAVMQTCMQCLTMLGNCYDLVIRITQYLLQSQLTQMCHRLMVVGSQSSSLDTKDRSGAGAVQLLLISRWTIGYWCHGVR